MFHHAYVKKWGEQIFCLLFKTIVARQSSLLFPTLPNQADCRESRVVAKSMKSLNSHVLYYNSIHAPYTLHTAATQFHVPCHAQALLILSCWNCYSSYYQLNTPFPCPIHFKHVLFCPAKENIILSPIVRIFSDSKHQARPHTSCLSICSRGLSSKVAGENFGECPVECSQLASLHYIFSSCEFLFRSS